MTSTTYKKVLSCIYCNSSHIALIIKLLVTCYRKRVYQSLDTPSNIICNIIDYTLFSINLLQSLTICLNWPVDILVQVRVLCVTIRRTELHLLIREWRQVVCLIEGVTIIENVVSLLNLVRTNIL